MAKYMLDSNVWERLIDPKSYPDKPLYEILNQKVFPLHNDTELFITTVIFDLESIQRKDRLKELKTYKPKQSCTTSSKNSWVELSFTIGPEEYCFPPNEWLEQRAQLAFDAGIKVVSDSRVGFPPINPLRTRATISFTEEENEAMSEAADYIEEKLSAGIYAFRKFIDKYSIRIDRGILDMVRHVPDDKLKEFSETIAEWCDGDALAQCIGMNFDYFVTDDNAKSAGSESILSQKKRQDLMKRFPQLHIISTKDMLSQM